MSARDARPGPSDDGANQVWGLISTLVAGPAVWGAVGFGVDHLAGTSLFTPVGVVVGFLTSFYVVYVKATRSGEQAPQPTARTTSARTTSTRTTGTTPTHPQTTQHGRSEVPPRDAARPDPGDVR